MEDTQIPRVAAATTTTMTTTNRRRRRKVPVFRTLEFYVISAQELRDVRRSGRMKTYVEAFVSPGTDKVFTHCDEFGGINPEWNAKLSLQVDEKVLQPGSDAQLMFNIYARATFRDKFVGSVTILLADAVQEEKDGNLFPITSHLVFTLDGDSQGMLNICVPPGGKLPRRLESMSFKKVHSDRGVQLEAFPSFKPMKHGEWDSDDDFHDRDQKSKQQLDIDLYDDLESSFKKGGSSLANKKTWSWRL